MLCLQNFSTVLPYLVDYDATQSLVIATSSGATKTYIACCAMTPPLPDFPE